MAPAKVVLIIIDGVGDVTIPAFGDNTPLQVAHTPNLDAVAGDSTQRVPARQPLHAAADCLLSLGRAQPWLEPLPLLLQTPTPTPAGASTPTENPMQLCLFCHAPALFAAAGVNGLMDPVEPGLACGSDTAHMNILGYDPRK
jgi:hypothetical protein